MPLGLGKSPKGTAPPLEKFRSLPAPFGDKVGAFVPCSKARDFHCSAHHHHHQQPPSGAGAGGCTLPSLPFGRSEGPAARQPRVARDPRGRFQIRKLGVRGVQEEPAVSGSGRRRSRQVSAPSPAQPRPPPRSLPPSLPTAARKAAPRPTALDRLIPAPPEPPGAPPGRRRPPPPPPRAPAPRAL